MLQAVFIAFISHIYFLFGGMSHEGKLTYSEDQRHLWTFSHSMSTQVKNTSSHYRHTVQYFGVKKLH